MYVCEIGGKKKKKKRGPYILKMYVSRDPCIHSTRTHLDAPPGGRGEQGLEARGAEAEPDVRQ